ncbi:hypothetical protein [Trichococcus pasteurii]|uniref:Uncharacterized protein n=1 Tax=Trichococcus pasteurii TaxID=43064 RepID=A0A1W1IHV0_9LACT|nr:hypothetical protein [Trichococcus pasteurii]SFE53541.1 hypothetical protein SAMN04488086_10590 [Trichococcus pasteurii]SLM52393.1 Hypothetical protein TPAS_2087 [Trichococcus pasteurii]SSB93274.1 Hypothetical protein TPAS_2087 [Trichococcus pasteurii]
MELQERYIAAGLKHIPPTEKAEVEKAMRRIIAERLEGRGDPSEETEREVLRGLGSPRLLAEKQLREPPHLIGPELYGTYLLIVKIVMTVAVIGTLIGNTVDFIVNGGGLLGYFAQSFATALSAAIGAFGWVTLVFAIMERTAKEKILTEIQEDWSLADLPEKEVPQKPFSRVGVIIGIIFTVLFLILVNQYSQLLGFYYTLDGSREMIPMLNQEVFRSYLPYINGMLVLQLLFSASKLVFRKWTYPVATANLILNVLSFVLLWFILQDTAVLNPELVAKIAEATDGQRVLNTAFNSIKAVFLFIFLLDSFEGFRDAYKNSKKPA